MTESEWWATDDPIPLLTFLRGKVSQRKLRLFMIACCRRLWHDSSNPANRVALHIAEHLAEAGSIQTHRATVRLSSGQAVFNCGASEPLEAVEVPDERGIPKQLEPSSLDGLLVSVLEYLACDRRDFWHQLFCGSFNYFGVSRSYQVHLLRDIVRCPLAPIVLRPAWTDWNDGTVPRIAERIYNERAFDSLPILADALEEAGCTDADMLKHCRQVGEHVRGCWVIDALLGKS